jgi:hypothetical protein
MDCIRDFLATVERKDKLNADWKLSEEAKQKLDAAPPSPVCRYFFSNGVARVVTKKKDEVRATVESGTGAVPDAAAPAVVQTAGPSVERGIVVDFFHGGQAVCAQPSVAH